MKLKLVVALLGLSACVPAFADSFVPNNPAQSIFGTSGEPTLQSIADGLFTSTPVPNVLTDQSSAAFFSMATPSSPSSIPTLVAEHTANAGSQVFGIWFGTDTTNVVGYDLILGGAAAGTNAAISFEGNTLHVGSSITSNCPSGTGKVNCGSFTNALINPNSFGFYFRPSANSSTFYTLDQLNSGDRSDRVVSYQSGLTTNWLFAYEDGSDWDYNDMAVKVESITAAIPEPETYALMLAGLGAVGFMSRRRKKA